MVTTPYQIGTKSDALPANTGRTYIIIIHVTWEDSYGRGIINSISNGTVQSYISGKVFSIAVFEKDDPTMDSVISMGGAGANFYVIRVND